MTHDREHAKLERLTFFSDAVFAIAMTLLVIEVRLPELHAATDRSLAQALVDLLPNYIGFIISFLVIGRFWTRHHRLMAMIDAADPALVRANLLLLMAMSLHAVPDRGAERLAAARRDRLLHRLPVGRRPRQCAGHQGRHASPVPGRSARRAGRPAATPLDVVADCHRRRRLCGRHGVAGGRAGRDDRGHAVRPPDFDTDRKPRGGADRNEEQL
ncbi:TMEM175 family protein [Sphingomonas sp. MMS24-JH45]